MKCPHCEAKVSFFSKEMNRRGKVKGCPHCGEPVKIALNYSYFAGVFFVVALGATLLGLGGPAPMGVAGGLAAFVGMDLKVSQL